MMNYSQLEDRRRELRAELSQLDGLAADAQDILVALMEIRDAAGVSHRWAEPEPRGIDAHYATLISALCGGSHMDGAAQIATAQLVDDDLDY